MSEENKQQKECTFCSGHGYLQLLLGSETCPECEGTGTKEKEYEKNFA